MADNKRLSVKFTTEETDAMQRARRLVLRLRSASMTDNRKAKKEFESLNKIDLALLNEALPLINSALTKMEDMTEQEVAA